MGLTRAGTANKVVGHQGGVQNPVVGDVSRGELFEVFHDSNVPKVVTLPNTRAKGVLCMQISAYSDTDVFPTPPTGATVTKANWRYIEGTGKIAVWTDTNPCYFKFWVF